MRHTYSLEEEATLLVQVVKEYAIFICAKLVKISNFEITLITAEFPYIVVPIPTRPPPHKNIPEWLEQLTRVNVCVLKRCNLRPLLLLKIKNKAKFVPIAVLSLALPMTPVS
jgi:hypothetical protein